MKTLTIIPVLLFSLLLGAPSYTDDYSKALYAFSKGDYATGLEIFKSLAEKGDANAQFDLGYMYHMGDFGVSQDYKEAVRLYILAAEQGKVGAQYNLGRLYAQGEGVPQDDVYAYMWWNIAASMGHAGAKSDKKKVEKKMTLSQIAEAQRLARECVKKNHKGC